MSVSRSRGPAAVIVILMAIGSSPLSASMAASRPGEEAPGICEFETKRTLSDADLLLEPRDRLLRMHVRRAVTLFRFGRLQDALRKLNGAVEMTAQIVDSRVSLDQRKTVAANIQTLEACLKATPAPALATIIVRPLPPRDERRRVGDRPMAEVSVRVEDLAVGETGRNGTLSVRVPSGAITVRALIPPSMVGERQVTLAPESSTTIRISLADNREVVEESVMMLAEAVEDIVSPGTSTLTFRFATDDGPVQITSLSQVDWHDSDGSLRDLTELFDVSNGAVVARNAASVMKTLGRDGKAIEFRVIAGDSAAVAYSGSVTFRVR